MALLRFLFVWWRNATVGTRIMTWLTGEFVGEDKFGNRYYQTKGGKRRWVIYNGTVEASRVPPDWHGWLHHTFREPPTVQPLVVRVLGKGSSAQHDGHAGRDAPAWQPRRKGRAAAGDGRLPGLEARVRLKSGAR